MDIEPFLWRTIESEQKRFLEEVGDYFALVLFIPLLMAFNIIGPSIFGRRSVGGYASSFDLYNNVRRWRGQTFAPLEPNYAVDF